MKWPRCLCAPSSGYVLNQKTEFHDLWYGRTATGGQPNLMLLNSLQLVIKLGETWNCDVGATLMALNIGYWNDVSHYK
jgi:hypothetical protein